MIVFHNKFIVFEGLDGSGKTTQVKRLAKNLADQGEDVLISRDPGGTPTAEAIRSILKGDICPENEKTQALLFTAARIDNLENVILPHLRRGGTVIMDRFLASTLSMQGYASRILKKPGKPDPIIFAKKMTDLITDRPSITFLLDIDPETSQKRIALRTERTPEKPDTFEKKSALYHQEIQRAMRDECNDLTKHLYRLDGTEDPETISKKILSLLL